MFYPKRRATNRVLLLITTILTLSLLPFVGVAQYQDMQEQTEGVIYDAMSGEPIPGAHLITNSGSGMVTDRDGNFQLSPGDLSGPIRVTHISYRSREITPDEDHEGVLRIALQPDVVTSADLVITSDNVPESYSGIYRSVKSRPIDDHLSVIEGVELVARTNFAKEPVIRGLRDNRVDLMIDGMRLAPACVDGMDPVTAYVETDNLQSVEVGRGMHPSSASASPAPGGRINFAMVRPTLNDGWSGSLETGYHTVNGQHITQASLSRGTDDLAVRVSGTWRKAGDMSTGGDGPTLHGSDLEKGNVFASVLYRPHDDHRLNLRYIGDFAGRIGYPVLLMDTHRADAHMAGLEHHWIRPGGIVRSLKTNVYMNRVDHLMDDYSRDVTAREVMPDMYMPMDGQTRTTGLTSDMTLSSGGHLITGTLEIYRLSAFADMRMEHLEPGVADMYLLNLGDVRQNTQSLAGSWSWFAGGGWDIGATLRLERQGSHILDDQSISVFRGEYPDLDELDRTRYASSLGFHAEKQWSGSFRTGVRLSDGFRLPGHQELYGYYIYQPMDGFFYHGNPGLERERSSQAELYIGAGDRSSTLYGSTSLWINRMDHFIAGRRSGGIFKQYDNLGMALLTGFEADLTLRINEQWHSGASASLVIGEHYELEEPLPMMPPLQGTVWLQRESHHVSLETRLRWAARQDRVASENSLETPTGGYMLLDLFIGFHLSEHLHLHGGVENILDRYYSNHLSVNSMPGAGRNIHVSLRYGF